MRKSKNRYFYHIVVSPGDAPGAITLNVVWMEREFDAYKLPRCMCPSNYYRFWDRARYLWNNRHFIIPPCIRRPHQRGSRRNIGTPFGMEKLHRVQKKGATDFFCCNFYKYWRIFIILRAQLHSGIAVWMHVFAWMVDILNINFEPLTFCCVLFVTLILVSVNVIDINMCKALILVWNVLLCVWDFHTVW